MPKVNYPNLLSMESNSSFDLLHELIEDERRTVLPTGGDHVFTMKDPTTKLGVQIVNATSGVQLIEGVNYTVDYATRKISFSSGASAGPPPDVVLLTYHQTTKCLGEPKVTITAKFESVDGATIRLLRKKGEFARGPDSSAKTVSDTTVTGTTMTFEDTDGLEPGIWYYYSLIIEVAGLDGYADTSFVDALAYRSRTIQDDHGFGDHIYSQVLPPLYAERDRGVETPGDRATPLRRMLRVLGAAMDMVKTETDTVFDRYDPRTVRAMMLPELDYMIGWPTNFEVSETIRRAETLQAVTLWKRKGTRSAAETAAQTSSRYDATVRLGRTAVFRTNHMPGTGSDSTWTGGSTTVTSATSGEFFGLRRGELIRRSDESTYYVIEKVVSPEELTLASPYGPPPAPGPANISWVDGNGSLTPDMSDPGLLAQKGKINDPIRVTPDSRGWRTSTGVGIFLVPLSGFALALSDTIDTKLRRVLPEEILASGAQLGLVVDFEIITDIWDMRRVSDDYETSIDTPGLEDSYDVGALVTDDWLEVVSTTTTIFRTNTVTHITNDTDFRTPIILDPEFQAG